MDIAANTIAAKYATTPINAGKKIWLSFRRALSKGLEPAIFIANLAYLTE
jgi:hypothetical protein